MSIEFNEKSSDMNKQVLSPQRRDSSNNNNNNKQIPEEVEEEGRKMYNEQEPLVIHKGAVVCNQLHQYRCHPQETPHL